MAGEGAHARVLRSEVQRIAAERFGSGACVAALEQSRFPYIGSYDCYAVAVETTSGERFQVFLKDFAFSRQSKDDPERRRERELCVYRDLLSQVELGTPRYYGSVWDPSEERFWLLLELVEGRLIEAANDETGCIAASWLARLHGHFARHPDALDACALLVRYDADFFRAKAARASSDVGALSEVSARRLEAVLDGFEPLVTAMTGAPSTLVHGGYIPWHILLDEAQEPARVCPIDWELAGIGSAQYDLAYFVADAEPGPRERICESYRREAEREGVPVPDAESLGTVVDCFRLHRVLDWLSRSREKSFSRKKVDRLVAEAEALRRGIPL